MVRASAPGAAQGQRVVEAMPSSPTKQEPVPKSYHEAVTEAYHFGLDDEERERFDRGRAKRRAYFLQHAEAAYIDALDSVSVVERMEALRKIIDVFEPDHAVTADDAFLELQVKTVNAILEMLALEDDENMPKAQALCLRALISLYPMPPRVEPPPKKDPKDKKPKFAPPPKRVPAGRRPTAAKDKAPQKTEHPKIVDRSEAPFLSAVLAAALKFTDRGAAWYVRVWALRLVSRIAPWTIILGLHARKEEPNAESAVIDLAKRAEDEVSDQIRYSLIDTVFKMQAFAHLPQKARNPIVVSLADRMMVDPCINIRILILKELGPMVNTDHYSSQACDKEVLSTILCMFHDTSATLRCLAMDTIIKIFPGKDDQSILNQVTEQIRDLKKEAFLRRRLTAAKQILPLLKKEVPPELQLPVSPVATSPQESSREDEAQEKIPQNEGRELSVLVVAALASEGNKMVIHDTVKLLADDEHLVRLAAAKVLAHLAPDDPAAVTLILKFIEGMSVEEKKKLAAKNRVSAMQQNRRQQSRTNVTSRNQPTPRGQQTEQLKAEEPEEPEEKSREWIKIMAGVYALQLVVGNGPGREQMLKEIARLFPHYDSTVRHAVVEILHATGDGGAEEGGRGGARDVIKAALPLLKSESWTAREIALQVVAGLVVPGEHEYFQPILSCLSDSSWPVRHEAVMSVIKVLDGCTDPAKFKDLIKIAAPPGVQGKMLDGPDGLLTQSIEGEGFVLALDALRILTESDEDMRHMLGGLLKSELRIAPGAAEYTSRHVCEGTWLLQQPVSLGVAILLESRKSQRNTIVRSRTEGAELKRSESGSIFSKALSKFRSAASAEFIPEPLNSDELMSIGSGAPELPPGVDASLTSADSAPNDFGVTPPLDTITSSLSHDTLKENADQSASMKALSGDGHCQRLERSVHVSAAETLVAAGKLEETADTESEDQGKATVGENPTPTSAAPQTLSGLPVLPSPRSN